MTYDMPHPESPPTAAAPSPCPLANTTRASAVLPSADRRRGGSLLRLALPTPVARPGWRASSLRPPLPRPGRGFDRPVCRLRHRCSQLSALGKQRVVVHAPLVQNVHRACRISRARRPATGPAAAAARRVEA
eukprot:scaffold16258_cov141-Isochrysis_galbana.AAC.2